MYMIIITAKMNKMTMMVILMTLLFIKESLTQDNCTRGDVRLMGTLLRSLGVVEICIDSRWGRVCRDRWGKNEAAVVCNQLDFGREGALALWEVPVNSSFRRIGRSTFIDEVSCHSSKTTLLDCRHHKRGDHGYQCQFGGGAGVRCRQEELRVKSVSASIFDTPCSNYTKQSIIISWELYSNASHRPSYFRVKCFDHQHNIMELSVNNGTLDLLQINIGDLLSSTSFACCVSAYYYYGYYKTERRCYSNSTDSLLDFTTPAPNLTVTVTLFTAPTSTHVNSSMMPASVVISDINMQASIIGGVLGSIIIILLLLLAICGGVLLFLLRSRNMTPKTQKSVDNNLTEIPNNSRYTTGSTSRPQALQETDASAIAADYSRIGPSYETINSSGSRRQQPVAAAGRRNVYSWLAIGQALKEV